MMLTSIFKLHPATVHFPIGLLVLASLAGLTYLYWKPYPQLKILTWWPMFIGWVSCCIAVLSGLLAQSNLPPDAPYWRLLNAHITTGLAILLIYGTPLYLRWVRRSKKQALGADSDLFLDNPKRQPRFWITLCLTVGALLVLLTGWSGGQLVYNWGVNVVK